MATDTDYERGKRDGRREVIAFLRAYALRLAAPENRGNVIGAFTRRVGTDAADKLATLLETHFNGRI